MSKFLPLLCNKLSRDVIIEILDTMQANNAERELLLDYLYDNKVKVRNLVYSNHSNYKERLDNLEIKVKNFVNYRQFFPYEMLINLLISDK